MKCKCSNITELEGNHAIDYSRGHLRKIRLDGEAGQIEYICPTTGVRWLMEYPHSAFRGSGSPHLRRLKDTSSTRRKKTKNISGELKNAQESRKFTYRWNIKFFRAGIYLMVLLVFIFSFFNFIEMVDPSLHTLIPISRSDTESGWWNGCIWYLIFFFILFFMLNFYPDIDTTADGLYVHQLWYRVFIPWKDFRRIRSHHFFVIRQWTVSIRSRNPYFILNGFFRGIRDLNFRPCFIITDDMVGYSDLLRTISRHITFRNQPGQR